MPSNNRMPPATARTMVRTALKGALATIDVRSSTNLPPMAVPYASMVLLATDSAGAPLTSISTLALHTKNLAQSTAASLLIDTSDATGDPDSGGRVSLTGNFVRVAPAAARSRFLARHPSAAAYVDFGDFAFYRFEVTSAHLIEGFGRIITISRADIVPPDIDATTFSILESETLQELHRQWPDVTGFDWEGVDLNSAGLRKRLLFEAPARTPTEAHAAAVHRLKSYRSAQ